MPNNGPSHTASRTRRRAGRLLRTLLPLALLGSMTACMAPSRVSIPRVATDVPPSYLLTPGDTVEIRFYRTPELNVTVPVRSDGRVQLELVGEVTAAGRTPEQVARELEERYGHELESPRVAVLVKKFGGKVYVGGEVKNPSRVTLSPGMTALQAIDTAGGFVDRSQISWVILMRRTPTSYEGIPLELQDAVSGEDPSKDVELQAGDILEVPKKPVVHVNIFVEQYIQKNMPVTFVPPIM